MTDDPFAKRNYRWNFALWVVETATWMAATAFIDSTTVLPTLVQAIAHSPFLAGLILSIRYAGQGWPQLIAASFVSGKPHRKNFYVLAVVPGRLLLLWPAAILLAGITNPNRAIPAILFAYLAFWISEGFSIVPWVDMMGKTIPARRRGRLFAAMHVIGGFLGIGAGLLIRQLLTSFPFPRGYGLLFLLAFFGMIVSTVAVAALREPPSPSHEERYSTIALIKDIPNLLRSMPQLRLLVILQALFGFSVLAAPFYILFASEMLRRVIQHGIGEESIGVGVFLAIQTAGMIVGNALWGHIGDRFGNRMLLRVLSIAHTLVPLSAILAGVIARNGASATVLYIFFGITFFGYGGLAGGTWMGVTNFLLELAPTHDRPAYIAVTNALNIPAIVLPMVGGLLLRTIGYTVIFTVAALALAYAVYLTRWLKEPRELLTHHHLPPPES